MCPGASISRNPEPLSHFATPFGCHAGLIALVMFGGLSALQRLRLSFLAALAAAASANADLVKKSTK
jgi:hypothetical protein